jgi:diaminopimelate decarboxylase
MLTDEEYSYRDELLFCEDISLSSIAAEFGTPAYVYSTQAIRRNYKAYERALTGIEHRICYAVKANSNLAVLQILARLGAGFDIVSAGELYRVLKAGAKAKDVVFSGVGKTAPELSYALENGIYSFNCESEAEIELIAEIASRLSVEASVALRVNPDVDAITHPYISTGLSEHKFGVDFNQVEALYDRVMKLPGLRPEGVSCHIGSQLLDVAPVQEAADKVLDLVGRLRRKGVPIRHVDLGGGLGVRYRPSDRKPSIEELARCLKSKLAGKDLVLLLEPGRSIVADAGILLTRVLLTKSNGTKTFVVVDAAMNDLLRPTLYQAHHEISPVRLGNEAQPIEADVVGPVCETGDFLARGRQLPSVDMGDLLAVRTAGAYGFVLSSNYNSRPRACEVLVDRDKAHLARERESWPDLVRGEYLIKNAVSVGSE